MEGDKFNNALRNLFRQGRDPMFITDERGCLTHVNPSFLSLYSYEKKDIIGEPMGSLLEKSLHDTIFYKRILKHLLIEGSWSGEINVVSKSGEIIPVWTQIIRAEDGFSVIQVDLRDRDKITRKMEGLSRLQSVATLAGGVAHEFNNILGGIQGHLYLFKRNLPKDLDKEHERLVRVDGLMERATGLIQNLLSFSRQKAMEVREVSLSSVVEDVVGMAQKSMDKQIEISLTVSDPGLVVFADPVILKQHLFELISNAERALLQQRKKDNDHQSRREHINIELSMVKHGKYAQVVVRDNGVGMQDATLRHCLDPFFTTQPVGKGTGLGLSSASAYIQELKGFFEVESVLGEYTAAYMTLPLAIEVEEPLTKGGVVLLVDDDDDLRQSMEEILCWYGFEVLLAKDGLEAMDLWNSESDRLDAIVMDIIMPNMDGLEVAREIREEDKVIPICLTTGYSYQKVPSDLNVNLMRKPLNHDLLIEYLESNIA